MASRRTKSKKNKKKRKVANYEYAAKSTSSLAFGKVSTFIARKVGYTTQKLQVGGTVMLNMLSWPFTAVAHGAKTLYYCPIKVGNLVKGMVHSPPKPPTVCNEQPSATKKRLEARIKNLEHDLRRLQKQMAEFEKRSKAAPTIAPTPPLLIVTPPTAKALPCPSLPPPPAPPPPPPPPAQRPVPKPPVPKAAPKAVSKQPKGLSITTELLQSVRLRSINTSPKATKNTSQLALEDVTNVRKKIGGNAIAKDPRNPSPSTIIKQASKLRKVEKSPGGTPMRSLGRTRRIFNNENTAPAVVAIEV